jgi:hypothetical protein
MKKIISLFQRNYDGDRLVRDQVTPGAEWVIHGQGVATRKWNGTCCMIKDGALFRRYDAKNGKKPPEGFIPAQEADPSTGHWPGWIRCDRDNPADQYFFEAFNTGSVIRNDGTYELVGPKVQGNPEGFKTHELMPHGEWLIESAPRNFTALKSYFEKTSFEGIVWHHPDGRMVKIKRKDFGFEK